MVTIKCNFNNFPDTPIIKNVFRDFGDEFEYTEKGVFRRKIPPECPICNTQMNRNGYNEYKKANMFSMKIGKCRCENCEVNYEEDRTAFENLKTLFFNQLGEIFQLLRLNHVGYDAISQIMQLILPQSTSTVFRKFNIKMENVEIPPLEEVLMVHYDEQHPKKGRSQKYRLTLLDVKTKRPLADEIFDTKDSKTVKNFLLANFDTSKPIFIVTDFASNYPSILKEGFGDNLIHQCCLLHLNKLIVKEFPKNSTIAQELLKYRMLNIFYNREKEIEMLLKLEKEENEIIYDKKAYKLWIKKAKKGFYKFVHELELSRRRKNENIKLHSIEKASENFIELLYKINSFDEVIQKRLKMIEKHWMTLIPFHYIEGAPATNNAIENYYSTSLKTHQKKQFRTDMGIANQIKLSSMKRAGIFEGIKPTILEIFSLFKPFAIS